MVSVAKHYDLLIENDNDPLNDSEELKLYMDKWDGQVFIDELGLNAEKSCLEIGCGTGRILAKIYGNYKLYVGIDLSVKTIFKAKERFYANNISFVRADFLRYKFNQTFNVIYSTLAFMHIKNKKKALRKIYSLLSENGKFILSIDKSQNKILDTGYSKIKIYPDDKIKIEKTLWRLGFKNVKRLETENAFIFSANKY